MDLPFTLSDPDLFRPDNFVNGAWTQSASGRRFDVVDPGTGKPWITVPDTVPVDVEPAVEAAHTAFQEYARWTPRRRAQTLLRWHELIVAARDDLARVLVHETGKPLAEAYGEVDYATTFSWWFAGEADRVQGATITSAIPGRRALTVKQPVGPAVALVPWNFPLALLLRKASAALAAGCTMVAKTSPETPISGLCLARLAARAGFPPGTLSVLSASLVQTPAVAEALCLHPRIKKVTFTGSTRVGRIISGLCARQLKKCTLELGGNCPFIVFADANLNQALTQLMALKWRHAGQACISANRVYVQRPIHDAFVKLLAAQTTATLHLGHGMDSNTTLGPVTAARGLDKAEQLFTDAVAAGATVVMGSGHRSSPSPSTSSSHDTRGGFFMAPTIITGVTDSMAMSQEEIFAPLLGISVFDTEDEAVERANATSMGLASYVFTKDVDRVWRMFDKLEAGMIGMNTGNASSAEAPFGGIKDSGAGKESGKDVAIEEFLARARPRPTRWRAVAHATAPSFPKSQLSASVSQPPSIVADDSSSSSSASSSQSKASSLGKRRRRDDDGGDDRGDDRGDDSGANGRPRGRLVVRQYQPRVSSPLQHHESSGFNEEAGGPGGDSNNDNNGGNDKLQMLDTTERTFFKGKTLPVNGAIDVASPQRKYRYCTQACLLGVVRGHKLDQRCPNVALHRNAAINYNLARPPHSDLHPIPRGDRFAELVRLQLHGDLEQDCNCLIDMGYEGAIGCPFKITLTGFGYTFIAKGVESVYHPRLVHESRVYRELDAFQGYIIPVHLGLIKLDMEYPMVDFTVVTHMMLLSYAGMSLYSRRLEKRAARLGLHIDWEAESRRTQQELADAGFIDEDENLNMMWCEDSQRAMRIDFDHAYVTKHQELTVLEGSGATVVCHE